MTMAEEYKAKYEFSRYEWNLALLAVRYLNREITNVEAHVRNRAEAWEIVERYRNSVAKLYWEFRRLKADPNVLGYYIPHPHELPRIIIQKPSI